MYPPKKIIATMLVAWSIFTSPASRLFAQNTITSQEIFSTFDKTNLLTDHNDYSFDFFMWLLSTLEINENAEMYDPHLLMAYRDWEENLSWDPDLYRKLWKLWYAMMQNEEFLDINPWQLRFFLLACVFWDEFIENAMVDPHLYSHYGFTGKSMRSALEKFFNLENWPWLQSLTFEDK